MISIEQIKAARSLLDWTQADLAKAAGISLPTVKQVERRSSTPRVDTMQAIRSAFEHAGVEFLKSNGLRLRTGHVEAEMLSGMAGLTALWQDMADNVKSGDERLVYGAGGKLEASGSEVSRRALQSFSQQNVHARVLLKNGDSRFVDPMAEYRWLKNPPGSDDISYYVYGNYVAQIIEKPQISIIKIENKILADAYRQQFDALWRQAVSPPFKFKVKAYG